MFFKRLDGKLKGSCATYANDTLQVGDKTYKKLTEQTMTIFQCRDREWYNTDFAGVELENVDNEFRLHQKQYIQKLKPLSEKTYI